MKLYKCSKPGWVKDVGIELEAKEILYKHVCSSCLTDIKYEQLIGEPFYGDYVGAPMDAPEYRQWVETSPVELWECSLDDLLGTACGCEYAFDEDE